MGLLVLSFRIYLYMLLSIVIPTHNSWHIYMYKEFRKTTQAFILLIWVNIKGVC